MSQNNTVTFNSILVNTVNTNAGIFVGTNAQSNWNSNSNSKSGFGSVSGTRNAVSHGVHIFMDNDFIDTPIITSNYNGLKHPADKPLKDNITIYGCCRGKKKQL